MKPITDVPESPLSGKEAVIVSLSTQLPLLVYQRKIISSKMQGVPRGIHSVGRLQRAIKTDSLTSLLESFLSLFRLVYTTSEVIDTMDGVKVDRYQLDRTDIITYVNNVVATRKKFKPTIDDMDLISILIVSFEASNNNWVLQERSDGEGLHFDMVKLYEQILALPYDELPVYSASEDDIVKLGNHPGYKRFEDEADREHAATIYRYALLRIVDHAYSLLMDTSIWTSFVAPRTRADVATSMERSKTLRVFAGYLQSLLNYYQFFSLEMMLAGYDIIQQWIHHFPPLAAETATRIDSIMRPADFLGAKEDVHKLLSSLSANAEKDIKAITLPREFIGAYGINRVIEQATLEADSLAVNVKVSQLLELDDDKYLPLLGGLPVSDINVTVQVSDVVLVKKKIDNEVSMSLASLIPSLSKGVNRSITETLSAMNIRTHLPFEIPLATSLIVDKGVDPRVEGGVLRIDRSACRFSYDYSKYIRDNYKLAVATDTQIFEGRPDHSLDLIFDYDKIKYLQEVLGLSYRSLIPSRFGWGERVYSHETLVSNAEERRYLIEFMSGSSFEIVKKELSLPHLRRIWATYFSSFATMYYIDASLLSAVKSQDWLADLQLVEGYGFPYGMTYTSLASAQAEITADNIIKLYDNVYLKLHDQIPRPSDEVRFAADFYGKRPYTYFAANSALIKVSTFVLGKGLEQFSILPGLPQVSRPSVKFGTSMVHLLTRLYMNFNMYYMPRLDLPTREDMTLPLVTRSWNLERDSHFLKYITFGDYGTAPAGLDPSEEVETIDAINRKIEQQIIDENKAKAEDIEKVDDAVAVIEDKLAKDVKIKDDKKSKDEL